MVFKDYSTGYRLIFKIKRVHPDAVVPKRAHNTDAGFDVCSVDEDFTLEPGAKRLVHTGLTFEMPENTEIQVRPRSGLALKHGVTVLNTPGTIDAGYRGEVGVILINLGEKPYVVEKGSRIAQLVPALLPYAFFPIELEEVNELGSSDRGEGGFGSTGINNNN